MMTKQYWAMLGVTLAIVTATAGVLARVQTGQKLGRPGVRTEPISGSQNLKVVLPGNVAGFKAEVTDMDELTKGALPADTSYGVARYTAQDGFSIQVTVVLMGRDRTSLHKPQFCLTGLGWNIDNARSYEDKVHMDSPVAYDLPVARLVASSELEHEGRKIPARGVYVYWFVAEEGLSSSITGFDRMWSMASQMFRTGVLQRWAYVSYFSVCAPGQEEATYERIKEAIAATVPSFQLTHGKPTSLASR